MSHLMMIVALKVSLDIDCFHLYTLLRIIFAGLPYAQADGAVFI